MTEIIKGNGPTVCVDPVCVCHMVCQTSPLCSHNTNGRDMSKPCSIAQNGCCPDCKYNEPGANIACAHCSCHTPTGEAIKENLRLMNNGPIYTPHNDFIEEKVKEFNTYVYVAVPPKYELTTEQKIAFEQHKNKASFLADFLRTALTEAYNRGKQDQLERDVKTTLNWWMEIVGFQAVWANNKAISIQNLLDSLRSQSTNYNQQ